MQSNDPASSAATDITLFDLPSATERRFKRCRKIRPMSMFYVELERRNSEKMGHRWLGPCRLCQRKQNMKWIGTRRGILDQIKTEAGCTDCGIRNPEHPEIYDFDHLPQYVKVKNIAHYLTSGSIDEMMAEVGKCEVVCSNCHRIRTRTRSANKFGRDSGSQVNPRRG